MSNCYNEVMEILQIKTDHLKQVVDLTDRVNAVIAKRKMTEGLCCLFLTHTTACLTTGEVGEGTERDLLDVVQEMIPKIDFRHGHDPSHAWSHMASSVLGPSLIVPVSDDKLVLGTWQSVLLIELDGPRERDVHVTVIRSE
jgi:secondary thiamine-phosphate synthase enzyme